MKYLQDSLLSPEMLLLAKLEGGRENIRHTPPRTQHFKAHDYVNSVFNSYKFSLYHHSTFYWCFSPVYECQIKEEQLSFAF